MLLCRTGLCPANQAKPGLESFCGHIAHTTPCTAKISYALPRIRPPSFCLISSEAVLLTRKKYIILKYETALNEP